MGRSPERKEEKQKRKEENREKKTLKVKRKKNEEYEESQLTTIYIFIGFKLLYFARKHILKKVVYNLYTMKFYLQFLCVAGCLKQ